ncbi:helix-turn-helix domain-containing protein [Xanthomonas campestris]|uniref:helix-turn-helix domain-containing protein n=1 Tax=Xanthomonas campestris TaxID=339 RepID=UPI001CD2EDC4|nr:helix-turn-helix transcriptional regulator [Xanthomonas campestris]
MTVGKRLKDERKRFGLTQDEMATQLGVSRYAQLNFEKDINVPGGAYLLAALDRGVDVLYVLTGQRSQLEPADMRLLSAFKAAPLSAQNAALAALGLIGDASTSNGGAGPTLSFHNSEVRQLNTVAGNLHQNNDFSAKVPKKNKS